MPDAPETTPVEGLTTAEAERIRAQMGDRRPPKTSRSYAEIIWSNTFTLFNLVLVVLLVSAPSVVLFRPRGHGCGLTPS